MTSEEFANRIVARQGALYRVTCAILREHADREDAVQSAIEKAWRKQQLLRDESRFDSWVTRILINECYAILRRQKRETPVETLPDTPAPPDANPDLYRFFTALPDRLRLTMTLHYIEGYEVKEIARMLHVPSGTIKTRLMRGREKMKQDPYFKEAQDV